MIRVIEVGDVDDEDAARVVVASCVVAKRMRVGFARAGFRRGDA
jgi:hypothetical protein